VLIDAGKPVRLPGEGGLKPRRLQEKDGARLHPSIAASLKAAEARCGPQLAQALR
jgi:LDH2 family malate/lactate/ureidoglycolate dehydrogenase